MCCECNIQWQYKFSKGYNKVLFVKLRGKYWGCWGKLSEIIIFQRKQIIHLVYYNTCYIQIIRTFRFLILYYFGIPMYYAIHSMHLQQSIFYVCSTCLFPVHFRCKLSKIHSIDHNLQNTCQFYLYRKHFQLYKIYFFRIVFFFFTQGNLTLFFSFSPNMMYYFRIFVRFQINQESVNKKKIFFDNGDGFSLKCSVVLIILCIYYSFITFAMCIIVYSFVIFQGFKVKCEFWYFFQQTHLFFCKERQKNQYNVFNFVVMLTRNFVVCGFKKGYFVVCCRFFIVQHKLLLKAKLLFYIQERLNSGL
eukprot:TRINITY_DN18510_c1_g1_i1.p1 TRINITY_DN18510_c1_g1~~TRINITY_DN18510_c1_g1_i1.p1  ORF type:complete len:305 (+),score=-27.55 TRINITY_DN18510_c1_g1_i1:79-993(+)